MDSGIITTIAQITLCVLAAFTAMQQIRKDVWWVRMADFPHVQTTAITAIVFSINMFLPMNWFMPGVLLIGMVTLGYQVYIILPYTIIWRKQLKTLKKNETSSKLSILESNVYQFNERYDLLMHQITKHDPDLVILLETDSKWQQALKQVTKNYPYSIEHPLDNTYGVLFYSKKEIVHQSINFLINDEVPSLDIELDLDGTIIKCYVVHPEPPSPSENYKSTDRDAEMIIIGKRAAQLEVPTFVAGDLNDVAWSHSTRLFQRISKLRDPRIGRGFYNTFHAKYPFLRWPLDHVFFSYHWKVKSMCTLDKVGSDHLPVFIEVGLVDGLKKHMMMDTLDEEDKIEIAEKLQDANN